MRKHHSSKARQADRRQQQEADAGVPVAFKIGDHQFRAFDGLNAAFGARDSDYPTREAIPSEFQRGNRYAEVFSKLFFNGGKLSEFGLRPKAGTHEPSFYATLRALMCSWAPKHEIKQATVAWFLAEHTEALPGAGR